MTYLTDPFSNSCEILPSTKWLLLTPRNLIIDERSVESIFSKVNEY